MGALAILEHLLGEADDGPSPAVVGGGGYGFTFVCHRLPGVAAQVEQARQFWWWGTGVDEKWFHAGHQVGR